MRINALIPFLLPLAVQAADLRLSGKVFDASGAPLFGVGVDLRKAKVGTSTGPDGSWQLTGIINIAEASVEAPDTLVYMWNGTNVGSVPEPTYEQSMIAQVVREAGGSEEPDVAVAAACSDPTTSPSDRQQGLYARQSVSHLGNPILRRSANGLSPGQLAIVRGKLAESFRLPRFDDNPLPLQITSRFDRQLRKREDRSDEEITGLVDRTLVPPLMEVLSRKGLDRALDLRTDGQKSSAVAVDMKTDDITTDQLRKVMNASWIYIPVVDDVFRTEDGDLLTTEVAMTLMWYHIVCDSSEKRLQARLERTVTASGRMIASKSKRSDAADFTLRSATESCVKSLLVKTKQMEAFNVSGQVWEAGKLATTLDIGRREGVRMNDQYLLIENVEGPDKQTRQTEVGWVRTYRVLGGDSVSRTRARIVSGEPYRGLSLRESPVSNLSFEFGYLREPVTIHEKERCETYEDFDYYYGPVTRQFCSDLDKAPSHGSLQGLQLGAQYAIPLWYGLSAGLGMNFLGGEEFVMDVKTSVRQSIPIYRRLSAYVEPEAAIRIMPAGDPRNPSDTTWVPPGVLQWGILWGVEYALAPNVNLRVHFGSSNIDGFDYSKDGVKTEMSNDGTVFGISLQWSLRSVAVDPLDALAGGAFLPGGGSGSGAGVPQGGNGANAGSSVQGTPGSDAPRVYQQTKWRLESERKQLESQLKRAERESGKGSAPYQSSVSGQIQNIYSRISKIEEQLIDLEYKKRRGEIQ